MTKRLAALCLALGSTCPILAQGTYFPPGESQGGWRSLIDYGSTPSSQQKQTITRTVNIDWNRLNEAWNLLAPHGGSFLVLRDGWVAGEFGTRDLYSIASCTKSVTALTMQRLFDMSDAGLLPKTVSETDFAFEFLPSSWTAGDPAKKDITIRHLMTMSSGLQPDDNPLQTQAYQDFILTLPVEELPDTTWVYASAPVDLLSLIVQDVTGMRLADFFAAEVATDLALESAVWANMGSATVASAYLDMTARDLARIGYCVLHDGAWDLGSGQFQAVSAARALAARQPFATLPSTTFGSPNFFTNDPSSHLRYGKLIWTYYLDTDYVSSEVAADAFYMSGFATNFCVVVPKYDLVVVRLGENPRPWDDDLFVDVMDKVMESVLDLETHASVNLEGSGCGPGTPPVLHSTPPWIGGTWNIMFPNLSPGAIYILIYGIPAPGGLALGSGCSLAFGLPYLGYAVMTPGQELLPLVIPNNPSLAGIELAFQGVVASPWIGEFMTNGFQMRIGH